VSAVRPFARRAHGAHQTRGPQPVAVQTVGWTKGNSDTGGAAGTSLEGVVVRAKEELMAVAPLGTQNLQDLGRSLHIALDRNADSKLDLQEFNSFLTGLVSSLTTGDGTAATGFTSPYLPPTNSSSNPISTLPIPSLPSTKEAGFGDWRDFVWGQNQSGWYEYMPVAPPDVQVSSDGYSPGPFRDQLEGFNFDKMDPNHHDGMVLKYVASRVFEQVDVNDPDAAEKAAEIFNQLGIPAKVVHWDMIDFQNGENPIDVIRGGEGDSRGWQWLNT
jgi:hypothetical protein